MLFCHFAKSTSVRDISNGLRSATGNLNHLGIKTAPSKSSISYQNGKRDADLFKDVYFKLLEQLGLMISKAEAAMACPQPDSDGWIKWEGGKRPVDADTLVDCKLRDGYVERCQKASLFDWSDIDFDTDIIAYRIVEGD